MITRIIPYLFLLALGLIAMIGYANAEVDADVMLCKTQDAIEQYIDKKFVKKEPYSLPGCIFARALFAPVEMVRTISVDGQVFEIWRVAVVAQEVDGKSTGFLEAQERYAMRHSVVPTQDI